MHLDGRLPTDWGARHGSSLLRRAEPPTQTIAFVVVGVIVFIIIICSIAAIYTRRKKGSTRSAGQKTKEGRRWSRLNPFKSHARRYQAASDGHDSSELNATSSNTRQDVEQATRTETSRNSNNAGATVDRNASIRSVMTLPAYRRAASNTEQVLGREGERGGVDVVVDFPTNQDEEALREQEMDALYQLRATRRQQQAERDELRRQRREAQRRNDYATLTELRNRARAASNSNQSLVDELRRDIDRAKENRQRSVSSVSYADLGVARHDGTRLRANSQESERMGLLSDAADMGHHTRSGANSPNPQGRHRSTSDVSADSEIPSPGLAGAHGDSQPGTPRFSTQSARSHGGRAGSSPELVDGDLGVEAMPPPEYEDVSLDDNDRSTTPMHEPPPDYPGPYRSDSQRSRRSQFEREQAQVQAATEQEAAPAPRGRGVGGVPQLPSLRIGRLPEIVIEPSSAHPRDDDIDENGISPERH